MNRVSAMMTNAMAEAIVGGGERGTTSLTVLYDVRCSLCRRLKAWLATKSTLTGIEFVAADSCEAHQRFPDLDHHRTTSVLTVVDDGGAVYEGERAFLVCGWTLPEWRPVVERFDSRSRLRLAKVAARLVDVYRHRQLRHSPAACRGGGCHVAARRSARLP